MQKKYSGIILILSMINWFPIMAYVFFYPPMPFSVIFLVMSFCSPIIAIINIIIIIFMMFKKFSKVNFGIVIIALNLLYLLWSRYYLDVLYHMT